MRKIKSITLLLLLTTTFGCQNKADLKKELLNSLEDTNLGDDFSGYYSEPSKEKLKLKDSDFWIEYKIDSVLFNPCRFEQTRSIKADEYSEEREIKIFSMELHVTLTNLNSRYLEFSPQNDFDISGIPNGFNNGVNGYSLHYSHNVKLDANKSEKIVYSRTGDYNAPYDETINDFYIGPFNTSDKSNNPKKVYFKINYKSKKVIGKLFLNKTDFLRDFISKE